MITNPLPDTGGLIASDPVVRYTAAGIVGATTLSSLAIVVHGYWISPNYAVPGVVAGFLFAILSGAFTLLGVHTGGNQATQGAVTQARLTNGNGGNHASP